MRPIGRNGPPQGAVEVGGAFSIESVSRDTSSLIRVAAALASSGTGASATIPARASKAREASGLHLSIQPETTSAFAGVSSMRCRSSAVVHARCQRASSSSEKWMLVRIGSPRPPAVAALPRSPAAGR